MVLRGALSVVWRGAWCKWDEWCALWWLWYVKVVLWCVVVAVIYQLFFSLHWCSFGGAGRDDFIFSGFAGTI